jgi:hypothetical protein
MKKQEMTNREKLIRRLVSLLMPGYSIYRTRVIMKERSDKGILKGPKSEVSDGPKRIPRFTMLK